MYHYEDPKILKWLRDHPTHTRKVGANIGLAGSPGPSSSSTAPAPSVEEAEPAPPVKPPGDVHVIEGFDASDFTDVASLLVGHGVSEVDAQRFICSVVKAHQGAEPRKAVGFFEVYGQGGLTRAARRYRGLHVQGLQVMDLRTVKPDGEPWDFTQAKDRRLAMRLVREQKPTWIIAAPPCTACTLLNANVNYPKMPDHEVRRRIGE